VLEKLNLPTSVDRHSIRTKLIPHCIEYVSHISGTKCTHVSVSISVGKSLSESVESKPGTRRSSAWPGTCGRKVFEGLVHCFWRIECMSRTSTIKSVLISPPVATWSWAPELLLELLLNHVFSHGNLPLCLRGGLGGVNYNIGSKNQTPTLSHRGIKRSWDSAGARSLDKARLVTSLYIEQQDLVVACKNN
jgi:hypothetical protein